MKQLTEFTGIVLQNAVKAVLTQPAILTSTPTQPVAVAAPSADSSESAEANAEAGAEEAPASEPAKIVRPQEALIGHATGLSGDRLARLTDAVEIFGKQAGNIRLVRVFTASEAPAQARKVGEFAFIAENFTQPKPQHADKRDGKKGGRKGGGGGGGRPQTKGPAKKEDPDAEAVLSGRFSMDAVKEDRKRRLASGAAHERGKKRPRVTKTERPVQPPR